MKALEEANKLCEEQYYKISVNESCPGYLLEWCPEIEGTRVEHFRNGNTWITKYAPPYSLKYKYRKEYETFEAAARDVDKLKIQKIIEPKCVYYKKEEKQK